MVDDSDWRLTGQERYLMGSTLYRQRWTQTREHWDHDHCEFCWAEFADSDDPEILHEGYTDTKQYRWICSTCFEDFRDRFAWRLAKSI